MKAAVLVLCMLSVAVMGLPPPGSNHGSLADLLNRESIKSCLTQMNIKMEDLETMRKNDDPKLDCLDSCIMTEEKIMNEEGNIDLDKLVKDSIEISQMIKPDLNVQEYEAVVRSCAEKAKEVKDKCQKAKSIVDCSCQN